MHYLAAAAPSAPAPHTGCAAACARPGARALRRGRPGRARVVSGCLPTLTEPAVREAEPAGASAQEAGDAGRAQEADEAEPDGKDCFICKQRLPFIKFKRNGRARDGYTRACRDCSGTTAPVTVDSKRCSACKEVKPWHAFTRSSNPNSDGLHPRCAACNTEAVKRSQRAHIERNQRRGGRSLEPQECTSCRQVKPASAFGTDLSNASGLLFRCKQCVKEEHRRKYVQLPPLEPPPTKVCNDCGLRLPSSAFYAHKMKATGLQTDCKACILRRYRERFAQQKAAAAATAAAAAASPDASGE